MGDYPWMTDMGTFVINGAERVVVSQLVRSPACTTARSRTRAPGAMLYTAKVIPNRGAWLEFETQQQATSCGSRSTASGRSRRPPCSARSATSATTRSRACSPPSTRTSSTSTSPRRSTRTSTKTQDEALIEVYKKLRPGDPPTGDNARQLVESLFFNFRRYDLGRVGRYKFNKKLDAVAARMGIELPRETPQRTITREDIAAIVGHLIESNNGLQPRTTSTTSATAASAPTAS